MRSNECNIFSIMIHLTEKDRLWLLKDYWLLCGLEFNWAFSISWLIFYICHDQMWKVSSKHYKIIRWFWQNGWNGMVDTQSSVSKALLWSLIMHIARDVWLLLLQRICLLMNSLLTVWNQAHGAKKALSRTSHMQKGKLLKSRAFELPLLRTEFLNVIHLPQFRHLKLSQMNFR